MKEFISTHLPAARSLAGIAREILAETRQAAVTKVSDLQAQVDDLWRAAEDMLPRTKTADLIDHVERTIKALRKRDLIGFPKVQTS